jgi:hypothetical protein
VIEWLQDICRSSQLLADTHRQDRAWDEWLNCHSEREIEALIDVPQKTINDWLSEKRKAAESTARG